jgi:hypothetical protein
MKNKGLSHREFHCRRPGDHAKAGKSRESNRAIVNPSSQTTANAVRAEKRAAAGMLA